MSNIASKLANSVRQTKELQTEEKTKAQTTEKASPKPKAKPKPAAKKPEQTEIKRFVSRRCWPD